MQNYLNNSYNTYNISQWIDEIMDLLFTILLLEQSFPISIIFKEENVSPFF